jgi:hypothetical protein
MNPGQEQFFHFILERVTPESQESIKAVLLENFKKQAEGTFTREEMQATQTALMKVLKPEAVEEVKTAMAHFSSQMK